jgi:hypothetical protein
VHRLVGVVPQNMTGPYQLAANFSALLNVRQLTDIF